MTTSLPTAWPPAAGPRRRRFVVPAAWLVIALGVALWSVAPLVVAPGRISLFPVGAALIAGAAYVLSQRARDDRHDREQHLRAATVAAVQALDATMREVLGAVTGNHSALLDRLGAQHAEVLHEWRAALPTEPQHEPEPPADQPATTSVWVPCPSSGSDPAMARDPLGGDELFHPGYADTGWRSRP